jgi:hypothetical protein
MTTEFIKSSFNTSMASWHTTSAERSATAISEAGETFSSNSDWFRSTPLGSCFYACGVTEPHAPKMVEDKAHGAVFIDGVRVWGFVQGFLSPCGHPQIYSERYDAHFCAVDDKWLEAACGGADCVFCPGRPARPSVGPLDEPAED